MFNLSSIIIFICFVFQYSCSSSISSDTSYCSYKEPVAKKFLFPELRKAFVALKREKPQSVRFMNYYNEYRMLQNVLVCNHFFNLVKPLISKTKLSWMSDLVGSACANEWSNVDKILEKREKLRSIILLQLFKNVFSNYLSINQKKYKPDMDGDFVFKSIEQALSIFPFDDLEHLEGIFNTRFLAIADKLKARRNNDILYVF